uniref:Uncharacterized protein n=1 Tax=Arundo donax TaxID=35708 RepID=A0A0A9GMU5_ARUDO
MHTCFFVVLASDPHAHPSKPFF